MFNLRELRNTNTTNMHLYNSNGTIQKYHTPSDILKEFYDIRINFYEKRKEYMLKKYKDELNIYESKVRFIEEFIAGTMKLINEEDEVIEKYLSDNNYPKFSISDNKTEPSYDYLINMQIRSLTKKKINELRKLYDNRLSEYNELNNKAIKDIWNEDLLEFEKVYKSEMKEYENRYNN